jgi:uncharacterized protein YoxC
MTNEEFNRKIEFLLNRQAALEARMQHVEEVLPKQTEALGELISASSTLTNTVVDGFRVVFDTLAQLAGSMTQLSESMHERMKHTDEKINMLIDAQMRTEEIFNRHLREQHGDLSGA